MSPRAPVRRPTRQGVLLLTLALIGTLAAAPSDSGEEPTTPSDGRRAEVVFVANAEDGTVSVIDARARRVVRELDVLPDGREAEPDEDDPVQALAGQRLVGPPAATTSPRTWMSPPTAAPSTCPAATAVTWPPSTSPPGGWPGRRRSPACGPTT